MQVGWLIGKSGRTIKELQAQTGTTNLVVMHYVMHRVMHYVMHYVM